MMELPQMQRNYNGWNEQGRKKGFEAWGLDLGGVTALQQSSLTMIAIIGLTIIGKFLQQQESFCARPICFLGGGFLGSCFLRASRFLFFIF